MPATPATSPVLAVNKPSSLCCNIHAHDSCTPLRVPCCSHTAQERPAFCPSQVRRLMHSNTPLPSCPPPASQPYRTTDATCTTAGCSSAYRTPLALPPLVAGVSAQVVVPQLDVRHHLYRSWRYDAVRQRATIEQLLLPWRPGVALPHGSAFGETSTCMRCHSKGARRRYTSAPQCLRASVHRVGYDSSDISVCQGTRKTQANHVGCSVVCKREHEHCTCKGLRACVTMRGMTAAQFHRLGSSVGFDSNLGMTLALQGPGSVQQWCCFNVHWTTMQGSTQYKASFEGVEHTGKRRSVSADNCNQHHTTTAHLPHPPPLRHPPQCVPRQLAPRLHPHIHRSCAHDLPLN